MTYSPRTHSPRTPAIAARGIVKTFKDQTGQPIEAVAGVDVSVAPGEVIALLGPNGAGKTTFLDIVLGLIRPTAGQVQILGMPPRRAIAAGKISAVLQTGGLLGDIRVRELIGLVASTYRNPIPVAEAMARAGITELANRKVSKCSGGQQQRIKFALALLPDPELIILDEPTAGMDVSARREFWQTMHAEARSGRTVIFATHHLEEAEQYSNRIVLLNRGVVVADGPTDQIRASTAARRLTFHAGDAASVAIEQLLATFPTAQVRVSGGFYSVLCPDSDALALAVLQAGARDLQIIAPSLEEAFIALTTQKAAE